MTVTLTLSLSRGLVSESRCRQAGSWWELYPLPCALVVRRAGEQANPARACLQMPHTGWAFSAQVLGTVHPCNTRVAFLCRVERPQAHTCCRAAIPCLSAGPSGMLTSLTMVSPAGHPQGLQDHDSAGQSHLQKCAVCSPGRQREKVGTREMVGPGPTLLPGPRRPLDTGDTCLPRSGSEASICPGHPQTPMASTPSHTAPTCPRSGRQVGSFQGAAPNICGGLRGRVPGIETLQITGRKSLRLFWVSACGFMHVHEFLSQIGLTARMVCPAHGAGNVHLSGRVCVVCSSRFRRAAPQPLLPSHGCFRVVTVHGTSMTTAVPGAHLRSLTVSSLKKCGCG